VFPLEKGFKLFSQSRSFLGKPVQEGLVDWSSIKLRCHPLSKKACLNGTQGSSTQVLLEEPPRKNMQNKNIRRIKVVFVLMDFQHLQKKNMSSIHLLWRSPTVPHLEIHPKKSKLGTSALRRHGWQQQQTC